MAGSEEKEVDAVQYATVLMGEDEVVEVEFMQYGVFWAIEVKKELDAEVGHGVDVPVGCVKKVELVQYGDIWVT